MVDGQARSLRDIELVQLRSKSQQIRKFKIRRTRKRNLKINRKNKNETILETQLKYL